MSRENVVERICNLINEMVCSIAQKRQKSVSEAIDVGCTFFDTAEVHGTPDNPHGNKELTVKAAF